MSNEIRTAELVDIEAAKYHQTHERHSNSSLGLFLRDRRTYWEQYVLGEKVVDDDTEALRFGRLFHAMLLEPETVAGNYVTAPRTYGELFSILGEDPPAKIGRNAYDPRALCNGNQGDFRRWRECERRTIVDSSDVSLIGGMVEAIRDHREARALVFDDDPRIMREQTIFWTDGEGDVKGEGTGELMRARPDILFPPEIRPLIVDIKTIEGRRSDGNMGVDRWLRSHCWAYAYHRQAAVYLDAYRALYGVNAVFAFVFVEKRERRPAVSVQLLEVDSPAVIDGRSNLAEDGSPIGYRRIIEQLVRVRESGDWRHACERGVVDYHLPDWRMRQLERAEADEPLLGVA